MPMKARARLLAALAAVLTAALLYLPALRNEWAQDDPVIIRDNPVVHDLSNLGVVLFTPYWPGTWDCWRPLSMLWFAIDWHFFGTRVMWYHAENIVWHIAGTLLVMALLLRLGAKLWSATLAALVFAVHPVHVEAVANIVGRSDMIAAVFYLAACLIYLSPRLNNGVRLLGVVICFLLALGTKEIAVTLPATLLLLDFWDRRDQDLRSRLMGTLARGATTVVAIVGVVGIYLSLRQVVLGPGNLLTYAAPFFALQPKSARVATAFRLVPEVLRLLFWPADLSAEWGPFAISIPTWREPAPYLGILIVLACLYWAVTRLGSRSWTALALAWIMITYSPISQLLFPVGVMLAERTLYLTSVATLFVVVGLAEALAEQPRRVRLLGGALAALLLVAGAWRSWVRIPVWKDSTSMMTALAREHPTTYRALWFRAVKAGEARRVDEAIALFEQAIDASDYWTQPSADYAKFLMTIDRPRDAEQVLRRQVAAHPEDARVYVHLGGALVLQKRWRDAINEMNRGRPIYSVYPEMRAQADHFAALAFDGLGQQDSALARRHLAADFPPRLWAPPHWMHLARVLHQMGRETEARAALDSARAKAPVWLKPKLTLDPLPPVTSYFIMGFGPGPDSVQIAAMMRTLSTGAGATALPPGSTTRRPPAPSTGGYVPGAPMLAPQRDRP